MEQKSEEVIAGFERIQSALESGRRVLLAPTLSDAEKLTSMGFHAVAVTAHVNGTVDPRIIDPFKGADVLVVIDESPNAYERLKRLGIAIKEVATSVKYLDLQKYAEKAREGFTVSQWLEENHVTADQFGTVIDGAENEPPVTEIGPDDSEILEESFRSSFGAVSWKDREASSAQPYEFQVAGVIPRRKTTLFYGESQSGKSFTAFDLAVHVATGNPFHGKRVLRGGVIYCFVEKGGGARARMRAFQQYHNLPDDLPFAALTKRFDIFNDPEEIKKLAAECKAIASEWDVPLDVIVIDTHDKATPGANEIEKRDVSTILSRYEELIERTGAGVWIIHHANASGNLRGSLVLYNAIETVISITPQETKHQGRVYDEDGRQLRRAVVKKQSEGEAGFSWDFVLKVVEVGKNQYDEPITSCVVALPNGGEVREGDRKLVGNALIAFNSLLEAIVDHGVTAPSHVNAPHNMRIVDRQHWLTIYDQKAAETESDPEKRRGRVLKAMERAVKLFIERGYVDVHNLGKEQWVWWTGKVVPGVSGTRGQKDVVRDQMSLDDKPGF